MKFYNYPPSPNKLIHIFENYTLTYAINNTHAYNTILVRMDKSLQNIINNQFSANIWCYDVQ